MYKIRRKRHQWGPKI